MDFPGCRLVAERQFHHGETIENTLQKPHVRIQILRLYALKPEKRPFHELRSKRLGIRIPPRAPEQTTMYGGVCGLEEDFGAWDKNYQRLVKFSGFYDTS